MSTLTIQSSPNKQTVHIAIHRDQWERIVAGLGLFNSDFLNSLDRSEEEITKKKTKRLHSLRQLRRS